MFWLFLRIRVIFARIFGLNPPHVTTMTTSDMLAYLTQDMDPGHAAKAGGDAMHWPADINTTLQVRKHDWSGAEARGSLGYEASDSVLDQRPSGPIVIQTFDFGYQTDQFGAFNAAAGDGGQVIQIIDGWASVMMTQDGGEPDPQWFIGEEKSRLGWLMFRDDVTTAWKSVVAELTKAKTSGARPNIYNAAFTRYRRGPVTLPFLRGGWDDFTSTLDAVICEHYDADCVDEAKAMERFIFARGFGLIRWERWQNSAAELPGSARLMASGARARLPEIPEMALDIGPTWLLTDGRCWTNLCSYTRPVSVASFGWPALDLVQ